MIASFPIFVMIFDCIDYYSHAYINDIILISMFYILIYIYITPYIIVEYHDCMDSFKNSQFEKKILRV